MDKIVCNFGNNQYSSMSSDPVSSLVGATKTNFALLICIDLFMFVRFHHNLHLMLYNGFVQDRGWGHSEEGGLDARLAYHLVLGPLFWECSLTLGLYS